MTPMRDIVPVVLASWVVLKAESSRLIHCRGLSVWKHEEQHSTRPCCYSCWLTEQHYTLALLGIGSGRSEDLI